MSVKERKRGRPGRSQGQLTSDLIVSTARSLMQKNGKVPSIRQVSGALGVDAMAIYHYFSNKSALLEALTVSLIDDIYEPTVDGNWQVELERLCKSYLALLQTYPGLLETLLTMDTFGPAQRFSERLALALTPLRLSEATFTDAQDLIVDYMHGVALAMQCNPDNLSSDCIDGALGLVCKALEVSR